MLRTGWGFGWRRAWPTPAPPALSAPGGMFRSHRSKMAGAARVCLSAHPNVWRKPMFRLAQSVAAPSNLGDSGPTTRSVALFAAANKRAESHAPEFIEPEVDLVPMLA